MEKNSTFDAGAIFFVAYAITKQIKRHFKNQKSNVRCFIVISNMERLPPLSNILMKMPNIAHEKDGRSKLILFFLIKSPGVSFNEEEAKIPDIIANNGMWKLYINENR